MTAAGEPDPMVVRVVPDVAAIAKTFDYLVPAPLRDQVRVGDRLRVDLHGRRVGAWVEALDVTPPPGVAVKPFARWSGRGPSAEVIALARWAAWRWAGPVSAPLGTASPDTVVRELPAPARRGRLGPDAPRPPEAAAALLGAGGGVLRHPPPEDLLPLVVAALAVGPTLVVTPTVEGARALGRRLVRLGATAALYPRDWARAAGGVDVVLGARAAVWATVPDLAAVVVLDEHDEALQQEQTPTWHARDVAIERARRAGVPCLLVSSMPTLEAQAWRAPTVPERSRERRGWPAVEVVDLREEDPHAGGLLTRALARHLAEPDRRVVAVLNRVGRARLLACAACRSVAECERCAAAVEQRVPGELRCRRCGTVRPVVCASCGSTRLKLVRPGVARLREELEALAGEPVVSVTASDPDPAGALAPARIHVGTEAVLHHVRSAEVVAFLEFDAELLAPRYRAAEQALALVARAARVVGGRAGTVLLQTRVPGHEVVRAAVLADPAVVSDAERVRRAALGFPPFAALAEISGPAAPAFLARLSAPPGGEVLGPDPDGRWLVRAPDHRALCDALAAVERPAGRLRVEVDPQRV